MPKPSDDRLTEESEGSPLAVKAQQGTARKTVRTEGRTPKRDNWCPLALTHTVVMAASFNGLGLGKHSARRLPRQKELGRETLGIDNGYGSDNRDGG